MYTAFSSLARAVWRFGMIRCILMILSLAAVCVGTAGCSPKGILGSLAGANAPGGRKVKGSGAIVTEERTPGAFTAIEMAGQGDVHIETGAEEKIAIEADDNILSQIETVVRDGTLIIRTKEKINLQPSRTIRYNVTVKELDSIVISGAGDIEAPMVEADGFAATIRGAGDLRIGTLDAPTVELKISGAGDIAIEKLDADSLTALISGAGDVKLAGGDAKKTHVTITGMGDWEAEHLVAAEATVNITGVGDATVHARDRLKAEVTGVGSVKYLGDPIVENHVTGVGGVSKIEETSR
jgi:hypothetical protein